MTSNQAPIDPNLPTSADEVRRPTIEEAEAILTLVRGGWLKLELTVGGDSDDETPPRREGAAEVRARVEAQVRHLLAVPAHVTEVSRQAVADDLRAALATRP